MRTEITSSALTAPARQRRHILPARNSQPVPGDRAQPRADTAQTCAGVCHAHSSAGFCFGRRGARPGQLLAGSCMLQRSSLFLLVLQKPWSAGPNEGKGTRQRQLSSPLQTCMLLCSVACHRTHLHPFASPLLRARGKGNNTSASAHHRFL
jgi:hypothetical protein